MTKCSILMAMFMAFSTAVFSQTEKGHMLVGGTASVTNQFLDGDDFLSVNLNPNLGFFIQDNLAFGGAVNLSYGKQGDFSSSTFGVTPFGRYYFGAGPNLSIFLQGELGFLTANSEFSDAVSGATFGAGPGLAIFLTEQIAIEGILKYQRIGGDFDRSQFGLLFGIQAYLGGGE